MKDRYRYGNRCSYKLYYHIILVCKYRKKLLYGNIRNRIIELSEEILGKYSIEIIEVNTGDDHIHYLLESLPCFSVTWIVRLLKSYTTYHIWREYFDILRKYIYKKKVFWTSGYFSGTCGYVSKDNIIAYIQNQ